MEELVDAHEELRHVGDDPGGVADDERHHHEDGSAGEPGVPLPGHDGNDDGIWQTGICFRFTYLEYHQSLKAFPCLFMLVFFYSLYTPDSQTDKIQNPLCNNKKIS